MAKALVHRGFRLSDDVTRGSLANDVGGHSFSIGEASVPDR